MKIAIQNTPIGFTNRWIEYCQINNIDYKLIDSYANDIVDQVKDCDAIMWHHDLLKKKDNIVAKRFLTAAEHAGKIVFPSIHENWHYDDKISQKYLLELIDAPFIKTFIFYSKKEALEWIKEAEFPKVFKLKGGAGSSNVKLVKTQAQAINLVDIAFGKGFSPISKIYFLKEGWRYYISGKINFLGLLKRIRNFVKPINPSFVNEIQRDYAYFQEFIPNNSFDIRLVVINQERVFGLKRYNRENDFRASGSGNFEYLKDGDISKDLLMTILQVSEKLKMNSVAYDIVFDKKNQPKIIEISYAYVSKAYNKCPGYWDINGIWHGGEIKDYQYWMIEKVIERINQKNDSKIT